MEAEETLIPSPTAPYQSTAHSLSGTPSFLSFSYPTCLATFGPRLLP